MPELESWGRNPMPVGQRAHSLFWASDPLPSAEQRSLLPYGNGRSYGDVCLNSDNALLLTRTLDRFLEFDAGRGILRCEAGVLFDEILSIIVPRGWFLPVVPGTRFVTLGGAIANDIHGKNHHRAGTFGAHVLSLELLRSTGRAHCSPNENSSLFKATIGGLGLTGLILSAEIKLRKITSASIDASTTRFRNLDEYFELVARADQEFEFTVAWLDPHAGGERLGRGLFFSANFAATGGARSWPEPGSPTVSVPMFAPELLLNRWSIRAFNRLYYQAHQSSARPTQVHPIPFFFPLDAIGHWNRLYGSRGFFQFQCVVPTTEGVRALLAATSRSACSSFVNVLKTFGEAPSPGLLSFPRKGLTLAMDFARSDDSVALLALLERITMDHGGALYPAKDALMSPTTFAKSFPKLSEFARWVDPRFSSQFWRRVT